MTRAILAALAAALLIAAPAHAEDREPFSGFYAGAQGGGGTTDVTLIFNGLDIGNVTVSGGEGGVFAGYALRHDRFVGAVELEGLYVLGDDTIDAPFGPAEIETRGAVGASLIAGYVVYDDQGSLGDETASNAGDVMLYGRVGYRALFARIDAGGDVGTDAFHGLRAGGGVAWAVTDRITVRAEYTRLQYRDQSYGAGRNTLTVGPSGNLASVGVSYRF